MASRPMTTDEEYDIHHRNRCPACRTFSPWMIMDSAGGPAERECHTCGLLVQTDNFTGLNSIVRPPSNPRVKLYMPGEPEDVNATTSNPTTSTTGQTGNAGSVPATLTPWQSIKRDLKDWKNTWPAIVVFLVILAFVVYFVTASIYLFLL